MGFCHWREGRLMSLRQVPGVKNWHEWKERVNGYRKTVDRDTAHCSPHRTTAAHFTQGSLYDCVIVGSLGRGNLKKESGNGFCSQTISLGAIKQKTVTNIPTELDTHDRLTCVITLTTPPILPHPTPSPQTLVGLSVHYMWTGGQCWKMCLCNICCWERTIITTVGSLYWVQFQ